MGSQNLGVRVKGQSKPTDIVSTVLLPSAETADHTSLSRLMQFLGRLHVCYFNYTYTRSGTLFEGRFKTSIVQEDRYLLTCLRYIELNPVRAGFG